MTIAVLQHSNTSWDIGLRKKYRQYLLLFLLFYSVLLLIGIIDRHLSLLTTFLLLFSLLSFYTYMVSLIRGHTNVIKKRDEISRYLDEKIDQKKEMTITELRDIQDEIFITRQESAKVPTFFFRLFNNRMRAESENYIQRVNNLYSEDL